MLWQVFGLFATLSLLAFGGGSSIIPELQREVVLERGWLSDRQFVDFYALTQITPGPNMMVVTLVGFQAAGTAGAALAYLGMFGPSSLLVWLVSQSWRKLRASRWRPLLERCTRPIAVATMLASASLVARATNHDGLSWLITLVSAALIAGKKLGILPTMALAGLAGWLSSF